MIVTEREDVADVTSREGKRVTSWEEPCCPWCRMSLRVTCPGRPRPPRAPRPAAPRSLPPGGVRGLVCTEPRACPTERSCPGLALGHRSPPRPWTPVRKGPPGASPRQDPRVSTLRGSQTPAWPHLGPVGLAGPPRLGRGTQSPVMQRGLRGGQLTGRPKPAAPGRSLPSSPRRDAHRPAGGTATCLWPSCGHFSCPHAGWRGSRSRLRTAVSGPLLSPRSPGLWLMRGRDPESPSPRLQELCNFRKGSRGGGSLS